MKQNLNSNNIDKNFKLMIISAIVLVILFIYTMYKSKNVIEGTTYYLGIGFLFILLIVALILKIKQEKMV